MCMDDANREAQDMRQTEKEEAQCQHDEFMVKEALRKAVHVEQDGSFQDLPADRELVKELVDLIRKAREGN